MVIDDVILVDEEFGHMFTPKKERIVDDYVIKAISEKIKAFLKLAFMHRYLFILEITHLEVGKVYVELPSHLTLMSRFFSDLSPDQLKDLVRPLFERTAPIQLVFDETEQLGPKKLTVHMVDYSDELRALHNGLHLLLDRFLLNMSILIL